MNLKHVELSSVLKQLAAGGTANTLLARKIMVMCAPKYCFLLRKVSLQLRIRSSYTIFLAFCTLGLLARKMLVH
jgi:hypothetical protein